jgi:hypothetical protein
VLSPKRALAAADTVTVAGAAACYLAQQARPGQYVAVLDIGGPEPGSARFCRCPHSRWWPA